MLSLGFARRATRDSQVTLLEQRAKGRTLTTQSGAGTGPQQARDPGMQRGADLKEALFRERAVFPAGFPCG